jgi:hypothetical protein
MRCRACNDELNDYESTIKDSQSDSYFDLCIQCLTASRQAVFDSELETVYNVLKNYQGTQEEPED